MNSLEWLQQWYLNQCNGVWEHHHGVMIETLDNPGWHVKIDVAETAMQDTAMKEIGQLSDINHSGLEGNQEWLCCNVEQDSFVGAGGPLSLFAICDVFRSWVEGNSNPK